MINYKYDIDLSPALYVPYVVCKDCKSTNEGNRHEYFKGTWRIS